MAIILNDKNGMTDASYTNVKETFPASVTGEGRVDTVNGANKRVIGDSNTEFLSKVQLGDFIWFTSTDEIREVESVTDDHTLTLKFGTASPIVAGNFKIVPKTGYRSVSWSIDTVAGATINGIAYESGMSKTVGNSNPGVRRVAPVLIDTTVGLNTVFVGAE